MYLKLNEEKYKKLSLSRKTEFRRNNYYEAFKNENNCFLFALKAILDIFPIKQHALTFKNLPLFVQINKANTILKEFQMQLVHVSTQIEILSFAIKKIVGKSILIFYNQNSPVHAESIVEGEFSEYFQEAIKQYMYVYLTIIEMKIISL